MLGMAELILWKQITAELNGHTVTGLYSASRAGLVTVRTAYDSKCRQLEHVPPGLNREDSPEAVYEGFYRH